MRTKLLLFLYITRHTGNVTTLISILWSQLLQSACLTHSSVILLNYKKTKWPTPILSNTCERLFLYIARLISTWRRGCLYAIYCSFIWFKYVASIRTDEMRCVYKFNIKFVLILNHSLYTDRFYDISVSRVFILHPVSFAARTQTVTIASVLQRFPNRVICVNDS